MAGLQSEGVLIGEARFWQWWSAVNLVLALLAAVYFWGR